MLYLHSNFYWKICIYKVGSDINNEHEHDSWEWYFYKRTAYLHMTRMTLMTIRWLHDTIVWDVVLLHSIRCPCEHGKKMKTFTKKSQKGDVSFLACIYHDDGICVSSHGGIRKNVNARVGIYRHVYVYAC